MRTLVVLFVVLAVAAAHGGRRGGRDRDDDDDWWKWGRKGGEQDGLRCMRGSACDSCPEDRKKSVTETKRGWWGRTYTVTKTYCCSGCGAGIQTTTSGCTCPYDDTCWRGSACDECGNQKSIFRGRAYCCRGCVAAGVQVNATYYGDKCNCLAAVADVTMPVPVAPTENTVEEREP